MSNLLKSNMRLQRVPAQPLQHSKFKIPYTHKTTFNFGDLVPFYMSEVVPGSTFEVSTSMVARLATPMYPTMGDANIDYYYFFVPARLVWDHWVNFCGENTEGAWAPEVQYQIPAMNVVNDTVGSCYDHFGIPILNRAQSINVLPLRAYRLIWNEWFRDENLQDPLLVNRGDTETDSSYKNLCKVCRYPDLFSTALPAPQKGQPVEFSLLGNAPLVSGPVYSNGAKFNLSSTAASSGYTPLVLYANDPMPNGNFTGDMTLSDYDTGQNTNNGNLYFYDTYADLSAVSGFTVNQLREAFATQRVLEAFARCGTRYTEMLRGIFNTISPDARLQRPEYLGGDRVRVEMQQVLQTSAGTEDSPQGNTAAFSKTVTGGKNFMHTFTEHGYVIGVMAARILHVYQQGLDKIWSKRDFFDFFLPQLAHIGEQPILNREIYSQGNDDDEKVFGYQEYGYEYRYKPSHITGRFRSGVENSLDAWHYGDYYASLPTLSSGWITEGSTEVARTLAVNDPTMLDQLLIDIYQENYATLPMPVYSVPGLIDHF